jgi:SP family general alpha glucoside:H+ symporter-like MFS transporter
MEKQDGSDVQQVETSVSIAHASDEKRIAGQTLEEAAEQGTIDEKELSVRDAIKAYPKAILWSLVFSTCVIMEGYDTNLLSNFFAYREYLLIPNTHSEH